ncbi:MAG: membrane protein involved in aromatic hydrocarbon degradation [Nitrospira sp.]|nr:MAG: membrane protein involved in aromatic hydrocarbon degradation [Nitrospira sp.]
MTTTPPFDASNSDCMEMPTAAHGRRDDGNLRRPRNRAGISITRRLILWSTLGIALATNPTAVSAGSFQIFDQSASAAGQASAFTAQADDASAGYYNPAGMTQLRGVQFSAGTTLIGGGFTFHNAAGTQVNGDLRGSVALPPPSNFYVTANLKHLGIGSSDSTTVGLAVFNPFGTLTRWPDNGPFATVTTKAAFELIDIRPSVAFRPLPDLAIGLGADIYTFSGVFGEGHVERQFRWPGGLGIPAGTGMELNGRDTAAGFNASLLYTALRNEDGLPLANIGLIYRSQATLHLDGQFLAGGTPIADTRTTFVIPQVLTGGIAIWPVRNREREWKLELDIDYTGWKSVRNLDTTLSNGLTVATPANWSSGYTVMIGTEHKWLKPDPLPDWDIALRAGYWHSQKAIPDQTFNPAIPDGDHHAISTGIGFTCRDKGRFLGIIPCGGSDKSFSPKGFGIDLAYKAVLYESRTIAGNLNPTVNGTYDTTLHVGALNLRVNF